MNETQTDTLAPPDSEEQDAAPNSSALLACLHLPSLVRPWDTLSLPDHPLLVPPDRGGSHHSRAGVAELPGPHVLLHGVGPSALCGSRELRDAGHQRQHHIRRAALPGCRDHQPGIAPTPYILAKLASRCLYVLGMFLVVVGPTMFLVQAQGLNNDMVFSGIVLSLLYWSLMLAVLVLLGITISVVFNNTLLGLVVLGSFWYICIIGLAFAYAGGLSPQGVLGNLPLLLQGESKAVEIYFTVAIGLIPTVALPFVVVRLFNSRDL